MNKLACPAPLSTTWGGIVCRIVPISTSCLFVSPLLWRGAGGEVILLPRWQRPIVNKLGVSCSPPYGVGRGRGWVFVLLPSPQRGEGLGEGFTAPARPRSCPLSAL